MDRLIARTVWGQIQGGRRGQGGAEREALTEESSPDQQYLAIADRASCHVMDGTERAWYGLYRHNRPVDISAGIQPC